jgi:molybdate transport system substrate-binding protein
MSTRSIAALALVTFASTVCAVATPAFATPPAPLKVAAAADLTLAFKEIATAFEKKSGDHCVFDFGSTGLLEKQIIDGTPFDVFAAADVAFADDAIKHGSCLADSKKLYARGRIVVWWRRGSKVQPPKSLADLVDPRFAKVAIANPLHAPYGKAAQESMQKSGVWEKLQPKLVIAENIQQTMELAQNGKVDAAVVALSLAVTGDGYYLLIDDALHAPIDQAMVICGNDPLRQKRAAAFTAFVNSPAGRDIMKRYGFLLPGETRTANAK